MHLVRHCETMMSSLLWIWRVILIDEISRFRKNWRSQLEQGMYSSWERENSSQLASDWYLYIYTQIWIFWDNRTSASKHESVYLYPGIGWLANNKEYLNFTKTLIQRHPTTSALFSCYTLNYLFSVYLFFYQCLN